MDGPIISALVAAGASILLGALTFLDRYLERRGRRRAEDYAKRTGDYSVLLAGYDEVVDNLRGEVRRLNDEIAILRIESKKCLAKIRALQQQLRRLQSGSGGSSSKRALPVGGGPSRPSSSP
jgi:hypothetical protein